jgi:anaphase-promoting complex subunit 1
MCSLDPIMVEVLPIPPLSLSGRVPPSNSLVTLDTSSAHVDLTLWPDFHNGAAAALRLGCKDLLDGQRGSPMIEVTRNWIIYNRAASQSTAGGESSHAGDCSATPSWLLLI